MAETNAATGLVVEQWDDQFFKEYIQDSPFKAAMGTGESSIIQVKESLTTKKGNQINYALVNRLTNGGVTGNGTLEGNEEDLTSRSHGVTVTTRRNGVRVDDEEEQKSAISLRKAAKATLMDWAMEDQRDLIIQALGSINGTAFSSADATARDAWLVDNSDRVLFGAAVGNNASNDHSAAMGQIDSTNDTLTASALSLMKRIALTASPKVRPIRIANGGRRYYVAYANPRLFRDLKNDSTIIQAQRDVQLREQNNKLFEGGDIVWDGIVVKEVDDIPVESNGSIDCAPIYLCGAQALGFAWARRWKTTTEVFDYGFKHGCAVSAMYGVEKLTFGSGSGDTDDLKDHGVVTGFFAAVADS